VWYNGGGRREIMKKYIAMLLITIVLVFVVTSCGGNNRNTTGTNSQTNITTGTTVNEDPQQESTTKPSNITTAEKANSFGTYKEPNKLGVTVPISFKQNGDHLNVFYITVEEILKGKEASEKLNEILERIGRPLSKEEVERREDADLYMLKFKLDVPNSKEFNESEYENNTGFLPINEKGETVEYDLSMIHDLGDEGWYEILVDKGVKFKPAFCIGSPLEAPGIVQKYYFEMP
jgi:hypothetical protein